MVKQILLFLGLLFFTKTMFSQSQNKQALLLIDIQEFYFHDGFSALHEPEAAAINAALVLELFRKRGDLVVHIKHKVPKQMDISEIVQPVKGEKIFEKSEVNCFNGTNLNEYLHQNEIRELVIVGMQTHMCVEAATRAGYDLGYKIQLIYDACTTKDLKWEDEVVDWKAVHVSTLVTLKNYAEIVSTQAFLAKNK